MSKVNVFCSKCGNSVSINDNQEYFFCNKCGNRGTVPRIKKPTAEKQNQEKKEGGIPNLCTRCNGTLSLSENKESAVCEYCGAVYTNKTVLISRNETEIQKAELEIKKRKIEIEAEEKIRKLEKEAEEKRKIEGKELEEARVIRNRVLTEVWSWIFGIVFYIMFIIWAVRHHNGQTSWVLFSFAVIFAIVYGVIMLVLNTKRRYY